MSNALFRRLGVRNPFVTPETTAVRGLGGDDTKRLRVVVQAHRPDVGVVKADSREMALILTQ
jgi:hypothetical protein